MKRNKSRDVALLLFVFGRYRGVAGPAIDKGGSEVSLQRPTLRNPFWVPPETPVERVYTPEGPDPESKE